MKPATEASSQTKTNANSQPERESALLTLALAGRMKRLDETDLAALAELADDSDLTLAEFLLSRSRMEVRADQIEAEIVGDPLEAK